MQMQPFIGNVPKTRLYIWTRGRHRKYTEISRPNVMHCLFSMFKQQSRGWSEGLSSPLFLNKSLLFYEVTF